MTKSIVFLLALLLLASACNQSSSPVVTETFFMHDASHTYCIWVEDPTDSDDFDRIWANARDTNFVINKVWGESDGNVIFNLAIRDESPPAITVDFEVDEIERSGIGDHTTWVSNSNLNINAKSDWSESLAANTSLAPGDTLTLVISFISNDPTSLTACWIGEWEAKTP